VSGVVSRPIVVPALLVAFSVGGVLGDDWPTYRHDSRRSGETSVELVLPLALQWTYRSRHPPRPAWPPPARQNFWAGKTDLPARVTFDHAFHVVSDGDRIYFGSSADGLIRCLDASTGRELWSHATEGPVRLAPSLWEGLVVAGSDDGFVYCLDARSGERRWRRRGVEKDRRLPGNGRIISLWPVRSGVLIEAGVAHFCAGVFPAQGCFRVALDVRTGGVLARSRIDLSAQGYLALRGNSLVVAQGRSPDGLTPHWKRRGGPEPGPAQRTMPPGVVEKIRSGALEITGGDGVVTVTRAADGDALWTASVEGRALSLAVAGGRLFVGTDRGVLHGFAPAVPGRGPTQDREEEPTSAKDDRRRGDPAAVRLLAREVAAGRGYALVVDCESGLLVESIARGGKLRVVAVAVDDARARAVRSRLRAQGLLDRVSVHVVSSGVLPYVSGIANVIISESEFLGEPSRVPLDELWRVLRPDGGVVVLRKERAIDPRMTLASTEADWAVARRPPLACTGEWTHLYADAGNTACSGDELVGGELDLRWFGQPGPRDMIDRHHRAAAPLVKDGRLFVVGDERLFVVDAHNGAALWSAVVPGSRRVGVVRDCGNVVVDERHLLVLAGELCRRFDVSTGAEDPALRVPGAPTTEEHPGDESPDGAAKHWGYLASVGERVVGSEVRVGAIRTTHDRQTIDEIYADGNSLVTSSRLFAFDRVRGKLAWAHDPAGAIVNSTICVVDGRVIFVESADPETLVDGNGRFRVERLLGEQGGRLVALRLDDGRVDWSRAAGLERLRHSVFAAGAGGRVVVAGSRNEGGTVRYDLSVHEVEGGSQSWTRSQDSGLRAGGNHGEQDYRPVIVGDVLHVEPFAYHLGDGRPVYGWASRWGSGRRAGCGAVSASASALFFRNRQASMFDLETLERREVTRVSRPGCWVNMVPAAGLLLMPEGSSGCTCGFAVQASMAFAPRGDG